MKEGNVLFIDGFNTFYVRLYSIGHMVKSHSDSKRRGNLLAAFLIGNNRCFICNISQTGYHSLCYTSREALAGTSKMVQ